MMPRVVLVTDRSQLPTGRGLVETVAAVVAAGVDHVVLRELDLADDRRSALAAELAGVGAVIIAAHRPVPGCVAVHLPAVSAGSRHSFCRLDAPGRRTSADSASVAGFGRSCHSAAEVRRAADEGAAYATLGPFAPTVSKPGHGPPCPTTAYADLPLPTYALGGVDADNAADAVAAGAHGVAVMGALMRAADPGGVATRLLEVTA